MKISKLALGELKKHPFRTFLTVLLFSFALGTIAFAIAPFFWDATDHYLSVLEENKVKVLYFEGNIANPNLEQELKNLLPEKQQVYPIVTGAYSYTGQYQDNLCKLNKVSEIDAERMGIEVVVGRLPSKNNEYACSEYQFLEMKKAGITAHFAETGAKETRYFDTYEEAQALLLLNHQPSPWGDFFPHVLKPIDFVGIVGVNVDMDHINKLLDLIKTKTDEDEIYQEESKLIRYEQSCLRNLVLEYKHQNTPEVSSYVTYLPIENKDKRALFDQLGAAEQKFYNPFESQSDPVLFDINEKDYTGHFVEFAQLGTIALVSSFPLAFLFGLISFIMIITLETACAKTQREEIATLRSLGMTSKSVFASVFLRSMLVAVVSFGFSIGFTFFCDKFFAFNGYLMMILEKFGLHPVMMQTSYLNVTAFFVTLLYAVGVSTIASVAGYRRYRKKMPSQIYRLRRD